MADSKAKVRKPTGASRSTERSGAVSSLPALAGDLPEQLTQYRAIIESLPVGLAIFTLDLTVEWVNPFMAAMIGYEPEHMLGKRVVDLWPDAEEMRPIYQLVIQGEAFDFPELLRPYAEGERCFDVHLRPMHDDAGAVSGIIVIASEISDRKRAEEELKKQSTRLQATVNNVPAGVGIFNRDMTVNWVNDLMAAIFGLEPEQMIGKLAYELQPVMAERRQYHQRVMNGESFDFPDLIVPHPYGDRHFDAHYRPIRDETGAVVGMVIVANEITEQKRAELALEERSRELERSNADLEQFAYVASHDLQEPLRMVSSFVEILAKDYQDSLDEQAKKYMGFVLDGARRMNALIDDLLSFSRVGSSEIPREPINCEEIVESVISDLRTIIDENGAVVTHEPLPTVRGDPTLLPQLFQNLVSNGIKFRRQHQPHIHISAEEQANQWVFLVRDDGIGIEARHFERIFLMFQRLHQRSEYPGTGIGLAMCKRIVENHGGKIWLESELGKGTTFYFSLPKSLSET